jgi:hypothetical protein
VVGTGDSLAGSLCYNLFHSYPGACGKSARSSESSTIDTLFYFVLLRSDGFLTAGTDVCPASNTGRPKPAQYYFDFYFNCSRCAGFYFFVSTLGGTPPSKISSFAGLENVDSRRCR